MSMESHGGIILTGETEKKQEKTCPSATLSAINPTWTDPGANLGLRGKRPAINRLSYGTAKQYVPLKRPKSLLKEKSLNLYTDWHENL
jgi:hypothetical protein